MLSNRSKLVTELTRNKNGREVERSVSCKDKIHFQAAVVSWKNYTKNFCVFFFCFSWEKERRWWWCSSERRSGMDFGFLQGDIDCPTFFIPAPRLWANVCTIANISPYDNASFLSSRYFKDMSERERQRVWQTFSQDFRLVSKRFTPTPYPTLSDIREGRKSTRKCNFAPPPSSRSSEIREVSVCCYRDFRHLSIVVLPLLCGGHEKCQSIFGISWVREQQQSEISATIECLILDFRQCWDYANSTPFPLLGYNDGNVTCSNLENGFVVSSLSSLLFFGSYCRELLKFFPQIKFLFFLCLSSFRLWSSLFYILT